MKPRKTRYPKQIKTLPIRAHDGDSGREYIDKGSYFRCWHCGFICDNRRDDLSKDGRRGTTLTIYTGVSTPLYAQGAAVLLSPGVGHDLVLMQENRTVYNWYTVSGSGCPLCKTRVWKKP